MVKGALVMIAVCVVIAIVGGMVGFGICAEVCASAYNTKAVQSGCATRVLDTLSGDVKTVWHVNLGSGQ